MSTLHDHLAQIERNGAAAFSATSLAHGHSSVTRTVRRHRTTRAAVTAVAGVGVVGAGSWGAIAAFGDSETLAPGAIASPSTDLTTMAPSVSPSAVPAAPSGTLAEARELTLPPGTTSMDVASRLAVAFDTTPEGALLALGTAIQAQVPEATSDEGWPAPGTFDLGVGSTLQGAADQIIAARVQELTDLGVPRDDWQTVITEASMVEKEAKLAEDKAKIARVIQNRLEAGMKLELDSTVKFDSSTDGEFTTQEERETESPYNTYKNLGLPPGAIATPSLESIKAVLAPVEGDWLYFVTVDPETGEAAFASTFQGHQDNVARLHEWLAAHS